MFVLQEQKPLSFFVSLKGGEQVQHAVVVLML